MAPLFLLFFTFWSFLTKNTSLSQVDDLLVETGIINNNKNELSHPTKEIGMNRATWLRYLDVSVKGGCTGKSGRHVLYNQLGNILFGRAEISDSG